jgi:AraC-like DNA-binding protein
VLRGSQPAIAAVARQIGTSARSLQRRLSAEGTCFNDLVDGVRHEMALRYLDDGRASLAEVSYLLGFAHPNAFFRAFKRWTGTTADSYRRAKEQMVPAIP